MKRIVPVLIGLTALLTACPQPETPKPDPTTLTFTGTGSAPGATNTQAVPLTANFWGTVHTIGTLNADKTVNVTLTPAMYDSSPAVTLQTWKQNAGTDCDVSAFNVEKDTRYFSVTDANYESTATQDWFLRAGTITANGNGTDTVQYHSFWYVKAAGKLSGQMTCGTQVYTYDLNLQPGWNVVAVSYLRDSTTRLIQGAIARKIISTDNKFDSKWITYSSTK